MSVEHITTEAISLKVTDEASHKLTEESLNNSPV